MLQWERFQGGGCTTSGAPRPSISPAARYVSCRHSWHQRCFVQQFRERRLTGPCAAAPTLQSSAPPVTSVARQTSPGRRASAQPQPDGPSSSAGLRRVGGTPVVSSYAGPEEDTALPVYMCLDGDIINASNKFNYFEALRSGLKAMHVLGVNGIVVEVFWGVVEGSGPRQYDWSAYQQLVCMLRDEGFAVQLALCWHANATVPLPAWVLEAGASNPDIFYTDRLGTRCTDYVSLAADEVPVLAGRTPLEVYRDFVASFVDNLGPYFGTTITDVHIGLGPDGELKYPAHPRDKRWTFPGIGEFQCYDKYMLSALKSCAHAVGQPSWGLGGPHDAGSYCMWPHQTGFFHQHGNWNMPYGKFFLQWYSEMLIRHADHVLAACCSLLATAPVALHVKLPSLHWWYSTASHAPELTAGLYHTSSREGYLPVMSTLAKHSVGVRLCGAELRNNELMPQAFCDPEKQLAHQRTVAAALLVPVSLENHAVRFDEAALGRLEGALFDTSVYQGIELPQVQSLIFNRMCDAMFEPSNWGRFKDFARRVHNRADTLFVPRQRSILVARGSNSGSSGTAGGDSALQLA